MGMEITLEFIIDSQSVIGLILINISLDLAPLIKEHIWLCLFCFWQNVKTRLSLENQTLPFDHSCLW